MYKSSKWWLIGASNVIAPALLERVEKMNKRISLFVAGRASPLWPPHRNARININKITLTSRYVMVVTLIKNALTVRRLIIGAWRAFSFNQFFFYFFLLKHYSHRLIDLECTVDLRAVMNCRTKLIFVDKKKCRWNKEAFSVPQRLRLQIKKRRKKNFWKILQNSPTQRPQKDSAKFSKKLRNYVKKRCSQEFFDGRGEIHESGFTIPFICNMERGGRNTKRDVRLKFVSNRHERRLSIRNAQRALCTR